MPTHLPPIIIITIIIIVIIIVVVVVVVVLVVILVYTAEAASIANMKSREEHFEREENLEGGMKKEGYLVGDMCMK